MFSSLITYTAARWMQIEMARGLIQAAMKTDGCVPDAEFGATGFKERIDQDLVRFRGAWRPKPRNG